MNINVTVHISACVNVNHLKEKVDRTLGKRLLIDICGCQRNSVAQTGRGEDEGCHPQCSSPSVKSWFKDVYKTIYTILLAMTMILESLHLDQQFKWPYWAGR